MMGSAWDLAMDSGRLPEDVPNWWRMVMKGRLKSKGIGSMPAHFMAASFRLSTQPRTRGLTSRFTEPT